ncbi:MAG: YdcF family protein [Fluviibacter sp.]
MQCITNDTFVNLAQIDTRIQAIVILGGGKNNNAPEYGGIDTINKWTLERLRYGAHLQQQTGKPILVTGGSPFGGRPEADAMAEALKQDFHAKKIWIEDESKDTAENASYSAAVLKRHGIQRVAIISQAWHLPRAIKLFEQQGLTVYTAPTGYSTEEKQIVTKWLPNAHCLDKSSMALKEYLGRAFIGYRN